MKEARFLLTPKSPSAGGLGSNNERLPASLIAYIKLRLKLLNVHFIPQLKLQQAQQFELRQ